jgi:hypothetical protein
VNRALLQIPEERFLSVDLKRPFHINSHFDLVVCLEVAEHLPEEIAECFIGSLTRLGSVVLFSAAIPSQGGTGHINEQWPAYWEEHFTNRGYVTVDCIRERIWDNEKVDWWYAQNTLIYIEQEKLKHYPLIEEGYQKSGKIPLAIVHPKMYQWKVEVSNNYLQKARETELAQKTAELALQTAELALQTAELALQTADLTNLPLKKILSILPSARNEH